MRRRTFPGTDIEVSLIGISAPIGARAAVDTWRIVIDRAARAGVNLFDLTNVSVEREAFLGQALESLDRPYVLLLSRSGAYRTATRRSEPIGARTGPGEDILEPLTDSFASLGSNHRASLLVEWVPDPRDPSTDRAGLQALQRLREKGAIRAWGLRLTDTSPGADQQPGPPGFVTRSLSLLDRLSGPSHDWEGPPLFARDPMAHGKLDGSRFDTTSPPLSLGQPPLPAMAIREELEPVLRMGPLVLRGRRTLAQAALHYVIDVVEATSALIDPPDPRRLTEILEFESSPPLSPEEVDLIDRLPREAHTSAPPPGFSTGQR